MNDDDMVISIKVKEGGEILTLVCNSIGLFGVCEEHETHNRPSTTLKLEGQLMEVSATRIAGERLG